MTWMPITALIAILLTTLQATSGNLWTGNTPWRLGHSSFDPPGLRACSTPKQQVIYHASTSNGLHQRLRDSYVPHRGCWCRSCGNASQSLPANNCCPTYRPAGAQPDTPPGGNESLPPCFEPVVSSADGEVNGSTEWFDIGMYPDACSAHHRAQNTMEGDCLHASSAIVQANLKSSPATCLNRSQIRPGGPSRRLYVLGDSHATALMFGVKAAFQRSFTVVQTTCGAGCGFNPSSFFTEPPAPMRSLAALTSCNRAVVEALEMLNVTVQPGDVVMVVTASFRYYWGIPREGGLARQVAFLTQLNHEILAPRGASLVVTDDVPYLGSSGMDCLLHLNLNNAPGAISLD